ncbi:7tm Chemosensory receptor [Popillia japonica]|uniref:7tm Chemosensory receptor n=1 Tax=Popillia japonica TaxID=7064 RepID=A0AAW1NL61_POPJA
MTSDQAYLLAEEIPSDGGSGTEDGEDDENNSDIYGGIINYLYVPLTQSIRQISLISANIAVILTSLQFCSILMVITSLSANIRRALMEDFIHNDISSKELKEIINIYASLTDTASEFNKWISVKILLVFASQFLQVALPASSLIFNVVANKSVTAPALLLYKVGKNVIKLGVVIAIGQGYQKENVLLRKALFKIITEKSKMKLNKEVSALSLQLFHSPLAFSAAGFFDVNATLAFAVMN